MVTLKRYLDAPSPRQRKPDPPGAGPWSEFSAALVDSIGRHVLEGEPYRDIREDLRILNERLRYAAEPPDPAAAIERPMEEFRRRADEAARSQSVEVHRMLATMNEALLSLASGSERAVGVLKQMESTLEHASKLNDISTLKAKLHEVVAVIKRESVRERQESARAISELEKHIAAARNTFCSAASEFGDRQNAVSAISKILTGSESAIAVVIVIQRMRAIAARYGQDAGGELLRQFIRQRKQALSPQAAAFVWSDEAALFLIETPADATNTAIEQIRLQLIAPFEYRILAGGRVATLNATVRSLCLPLRGQANLIADEIDRFVQGGV